MQIGTIIAGGLAAFIVLAFVVEYLTAVLSKFFPPKLGTRIETPTVVALVLGVGISLLVRADFLTELGFQPVLSIAAQILTGVAISGGSKGLHELIAKVRASRQDIMPNYNVPVTVDEAIIAQTVVEALQQKVNTNE